MAYLKISFVVQSEPELGEGSEGCPALFLKSGPVFLRKMRLALVSRKFVMHWNVRLCLMILDFIQYIESEY